MYQPLHIFFYVKCSVRARHFEEGIPGHHNYSEDYPAGMFVRIKKVVNESIFISFKAYLSICLRTIPSKNFFHQFSPRHFHMVSRKGRQFLSSLLLQFLWDVMT